MITSTSTERSPLLVQSPQPVRRYHADASSDSRSKRKRFFDQLLSPMAIMVIVLILNGYGEMLMESPQVRIYESVICYRYYERADPSMIRLGRDLVGPGAIGGVEEKFCKVDEVQDELATVNGIAQLLDGIPSLLLTVPFGWAADKYGRWPILCMNLIAYALRPAWMQIVTWYWQSFDIRAVWFASALNIFGGGQGTASALAFCVASDLTHESDRAAVFLRLGAVTYLGNVLMPPLSAWLMEQNPWIPFLGGTVLMVAAGLCWLLMPETMGYLTEGDSKSLSDTAISTTNPVSNMPLNATRSQRWHHKLKSAMSFLTDDWRVPILIITFTTHVLLATINRLTLQYTSKKYNLTLSESTLLIVVRNIFNVFLLAIVIPSISTLMIKRYTMHERRKDLYLSRACQTLAALGWFVVGFAPDVLTVTIGLSLASVGPAAILLVRSLLASLVSTHQIAKVYTLIGMTDIMGTMFGGPLLARLFKAGMAWGGIWIGLPFVFVGGVSAVFAGVFFVVSLRPGEEDNHNNEQQNHEIFIADEDEEVEIEEEEQRNAVRTYV